jgi:hypothetical protein
MPKYMVLFRAVPSEWSHDPKQLLSLWEAVTAGGDQILKSGAVKEIGWFTNTHGYAMIDAESKDKVLGIVNGFFPYYTQEIHEIVPWEKGKEALLSSARMVAESM